MYTVSCKDYKTTSLEYFDTVGWKSGMI